MVRSTCRTWLTKNYRRRTKIKVADVKTIGRISASQNRGWLFTNNWKKSSVGKMLRGFKSKIIKEGYCLF